MTAALLAELEAAGGHVSLRCDRLVIAAPLGAVPLDLIDRLRAGKPALVAYLRDRCAHCAEPGGARGPLVPIGTADDGHSWVHDGCYRAWLAARRAGGRTR